jgi:hypothetical protein
MLHSIDNEEVGDNMEDEYPRLVAPGLDNPEYHKIHKPLSQMNEEEFEQHQEGIYEEVFQKLVLGKSTHFLKA